MGELIKTPLAALRVAVGISRNVAAVKLGLGLSTLKRYEAGTSDVTIATAEEMAKLYHVDFDEVHKAVTKTARAARKNASKIAKKGERANVPAKDPEGP